MSSPVRHLALDLDALEAGGGARVRAWRALDPALTQVATWGGPAAALAGFAAGEQGLQLAVGPGVRADLPTAARATVLGRAPLNGRLAEGLVGTDLGPRLSVGCDLVTLRGRARRPGAVLVIAGGRAHLEHLPATTGADPDETHAHLVERFGPCASLRVGPAAEAGVCWANLAAGADPPSYVGRGGLGAALTGHGLKAIAVLDELTAPAARDDEVARRLADSPRLIARAAGGTFELFHARAARGDLRGPDGALTPRAGADLGDDLADRRRGRHGCRGCPTPCGWTFEVPQAPRTRQGARFSAVHALGVALDLEAEDALALLACCNTLGLDAKEAGSALVLAARAGEVRLGERAGFERLLQRIARGELLAEGAGAFARARGLEDPTAGGEAVRDGSDLAGLLGTCVAVRGAEPMRSSPFLVEGGAGRARLAAALAPLALPPGAEDPRDPAGKGRVVWWHENLAAAVDASGFCAFAAAGALADGVATIDELAGWIEPGLDGADLLRRGAVLVALVAQVSEAWAAPRTPPAWAAERLANPGMWPEYRALRGLDEAGRVRSEARAQALLRSPFEPVLPAFDPGPRAPAPEQGALARGAVSLGATGSLRGHLGGTGAALELDLPVPMVEVLRAAALRWPAAAGLLLDGDGPLPTVFRGGMRLDACDAVSAGEHLELVLAVSGG